MEFQNHLEVCTLVVVCVLQANTSVKTIEGHYTGHFKAVVAKPQNVKVLRDVMANGYRAGGNARFFSETVDANGIKVFDIMTAKENIMKRLSFEDGETEDYPASLLAFPMSFAKYDSGKCSTVMSLTSRLLPWEVQSGNHDSFPDGEEAFMKYNKILALQQVHFGTRSSVFVSQWPARFFAHFSCGVHSHVCVFRCTRTSGEDLRASENMDYISQVRFDFHCVLFVPES